MYSRGRGLPGGCWYGLRVLTATQRQSASRSEFLVLAVYFGGMVGLTDLVNVRLGVELLTLMTAVAALAISRLPGLFIRDWWFFLVGLILWNLSGPIAAKSPFPVHLNFMLQTDHRIFLGHDPVTIVQHHLASRGQVRPLDVITSLAYNLHLPEPYIVAYFLWRIDRPVYFRFVASALLLLILGFITFILFPAMPPWLSSLRYDRPHDVFNGFNPVVHAHPLPFHGTPIFYVFKLAGDAVAAFPSEHAAFPLLGYLALRAAIGRRAWPFLLWVGFILFSIVYLGEHWVTDALAGYVYAVVVWALVAWATRASRRGTVSMSTEINGLGRLA
jgi:membrane-associated phospholipid phosphatase